MADCDRVGPPAGRGRAGERGGEFSGTHAGIKIDSQPGRGCFQFFEVLESPLRLRSGDRRMRSGAQKAANSGGIASHPPALANHTPFAFHVARVAPVLHAKRKTQGRPLKKLTNDFAALATVSSHRPGSTCRPRGLDWGKGMAHPPM